MAVFALIGITGVYLRQIRQTGVLGLIGYALLGVGYLSILGVQIIAVFVLPDLAGGQPGYGDDVLAVATSATRVGDPPLSCRSSPNGLSPFRSASFCFRLACG